jgi:hypothetical protein
LKNQGLRIITATLWDGRERFLEFFRVKMTSAIAAVTAIG